MPPKRSLFIPDVLEEHFEELQFLWRQRQARVYSPRHTLPALADLDERVAAHADGLAVGGRHAAPLLRKGLQAEKPEALFAGAYPLLAKGNERIIGRLFERFLQAKGPSLDGLRQVFCHVSVERLRPQLQQALASSSDELAVAAAEVLAAHSLLDLTTAQFERFLKHKEPAIRRAGWWAVSRSVPVRPEVYEMGWRDPDVPVREEALLAAVWGRQPKVVEYCRKLAAAPIPENFQALLLLAVLGKPEDLYRMQAIGQSANLGPQRFRILGAFGNPNVVELLLQGTENPDPLTAVAAGAAFSKLTGANVRSTRKATLPPADGSTPTDFQMEFLDEVALPDAARVRAHWNKVQAQFQKGTRWCGGLDLSQGGSLTEWDRLDLEARREAHLRGRFLGLWKGNPFELERFPQTRAYSPPKK